MNSSAIVVISHAACESSQVHMATNAEWVGIALGRTVVAGKTYWVFSHAAVWAIQIEKLICTAAATAEFHTWFVLAERGDVGRKGE